MEVVSYILCFLTVFSALIVIKETFIFGVSMWLNRKYDLSVSREIILATAISFIITMIIV